VKEFFLEGAVKAFFLEGVGGRSADEKRTVVKR
jgi:hypothetical protein